MITSLHLYHIHILINLLLAVSDLQNVVNSSLHYQMNQNNLLFFAKVQKIFYQVISF
jgi:hypothetical protein